ncbi:MULTISPECIES: glutathione S-transferase family protein [unclassified Rubrivivax]|uniref:glutathione S-transferase family protein n=1 Tax=unclassified Rubrivivax TaxID=2649762 RepID=UPI001E47F3E5|nr:MULTISPECIES: glutathione S-transferase family protein [unclassified Rubrivivax]MCC9596403.1 glutathione S-transferase family protein [Rubrivivax sp. JA1055]MCC9647253.1 glutathione S-transferase family protein [Rubrivivax sp. JA1029]
MSLQLVIGNKNYSSWSMRPWVLMRQLGIVFDERKLRFDFAEGSDFRRQVAAVSPAGLVPVLLDDGFAVWDTLAITEYLAERFPQAGVWPADAKQRARARSLCAEMHGGFGALRRHCAMNIEAALPDVGERLWAEQPALQRDVARLEAMWAEALDASGGPFLFGEFGAADAFYAPVCTRLVSYALPVSDATRAYVRRVLAAPGVAAWIADALAEADFIADEEPYRSSR